MASNDTAALVVALSAQLTRFEKDMKGAVEIADKRTKEIETRFAAMNSVIANKLSDLGSAASSNIGFAGTLLRTLGPAGVTAAIGIGTVVGALFALANATEQFSEKAKRLKEASETVGLTITQLRLLGQAGTRVGFDFDETTAFFTKFIANLEQLRNGSGPLYDALLKIDVGLLRQLAATKSSAEAVDILTKAFQRLQDQSERLDLAKAAGGRAGLSGVRLLDSLGKQGGLSGLEAKGPTIDEEQIRRAAQLRVEIDEIRKRTANIWGGMFSDEVLQHEKELASDFLKIAQTLKSWVESARDFVGLSKQTDKAPLRITINRPEAGEEQGPPKPPPPVPAAVELAILQKNIALLGEAVTQGELWKQKRLEIKKAAEDGGLSDGTAARALEAFNVTMKSAAIAARERLGIATESQFVEARLAQLNQDRIRYGLDEVEVERARVVILRESKAAADALTVRQSYLPGLTQLALDVKNTRKVLDDFAVSSVNTLTDGFTDIITGTKKTSDAFRDMANAIIRDISRILVRQALLGSIGSLFGSSGNTYDIAFPTPIGTNAGGTSNWRGGLSWVGEEGPELVNLPRGSQVIPNDVSRAVASGGPQITYAPSYDARGADVAAVARLERLVAQDRAEFTAKVRQIVGNRDKVRW